MPIKYISLLIIVAIAAPITACIIPNFSPCVMKIQFKTIFNTVENISIFAIVFVFSLDVKYASYIPVIGINNINKEKSLKIGRAGE